MKTLLFHSMLQSVNRRDFAIIAAVLIGSLVILFALQFGAAVQSIRKDTVSIGDSLYSIFLLASLFAITLIILFTIRLLQNYQEKILQAQAAERRTTMFAAALNNTPIGVMIRDMRQPGQPVVFSNQAMVELTGYRNEDLTSKPQGFLLGAHPDPVMLSEFTKAVKEKASTTLTALTFRQDGSNFWGEWFISPILDRQGQTAHIVKFLMDITTFRRAHEALSLAKEQAERASLVKANFLAMMSHEVRTPINGITGILSALGESTLTPEQRRLLEIARGSADSLRDIVSDVLDYSKIEAGKLEIEAQIFDLPELLRAVIDLNLINAEHKGLTLTLDIREPLHHYVLGDPIRLRQVLLNLTSNAIKYTERGSITLRLTQLMEHQDGRQSVGSFRFEIIDTGIGISQLDQQRLFERFSQLDTSHTRRASGTGLGLAITKQLTELMGGEIGCDSKPGQGSTFWIMLPLQLTAAVPKQIPPSPERDSAAKFTGLSILVAEDNPANLVVVQRYLEKAGCATDCAYDGEEALRMAAARRYDIILMDVSMPRLDGFEVTRRLRAETGPNTNTPIIALTAHVMRGDAEHCLTAGMNDYLSKPLDYPNLLAMLKKWQNQPLPPQTPVKIIAPVVNAVSATMPEPAQGDRLQRLADDLGEDKLDQIISIYLEDSARRIRRIREACPSREIAVIAHEAHALKSSSADLGLVKLADLLAKLEDAARREDHVDVFMLLLELDGIYLAGRRKLQRTNTRQRA